MSGSDSRWLCGLHAVSLQEPCDEKHVFVCLFSLLFAVPGVSEMVNRVQPVFWGLPFGSFFCPGCVNFQAPSFLGGKQIAHQEVALPCWNYFCQLTSEGCGTQPRLKPLFPYEGCFGTCCHVSTTACLKARASFIWEWFRLPSVVAMGGKQQSYWTVHNKYLSLSSVQLNYLTILWWLKTIWCLPQR